MENILKIIVWHGNKLDFHYERLMKITSETEAYQRFGGLQGSTREKLVNGLVDWISFFGARPVDSVWTLRNICFNSRH